ncbi:TIGR04282 family arsenosugar biosynthesis glycosyltransferase [Albibacillus kandeliae]|uniref:TIGR04282 family arsenosugar biosynthesis glycosyltransferase n=1 Tax=Albibacillus kandeliae TaxID=2174228 RepID=UPI000D68C584|nr:TIGR04282 family arsenosugar biosynthesis glycosyltransferase [Albibacillus kandeliae]
MVKAPVAGRVKTRLGREIGMVSAAWWFRHQVARLLRRIRDPRWRIVLAVSPDLHAHHTRLWPADLARVPQGPGDLGRRMARAMSGVPTAPVCVIGADIPGITRARVARAFAALGGHDAVFGPAEDGGYWLVGLRRGALAHPDMFAGVRWSGEHALADSLRCLSGRRVALVDRLRDVDTLDDLRATKR